MCLPYVLGIRHVIHGFLQLGTGRRSHTFHVHACNEPTALYVSTPYFLFLYMSWIYWPLCPNHFSTTPNMFLPIFFYHSYIYNLIKPHLFLYLATHGSNKLFITFYYVTQVAGQVTLHILGSYFVKVARTNEGSIAVDISSS